MEEETGTVLEGIGVNVTVPFNWAYEYSMSSALVSLRLRNMREDGFPIPRFGGRCSCRVEVGFEEGNGGYECCLVEAEGGEGASTDIEGEDKAGPSPEVEAVAGTDGER